MAIMKKVLFAVVAGACISGQAFANFVSIGTYGGREFFVSDEIKNVTDHEADAAGLGLFLASFQSQDEFDWVRTNVSQNQFLIGFTDRDNEGTFAWMDGSPVSFTAWSPGEPNNVGNEDFTVMNWGANGTWNDVPGSYAARAIAVNPVPEPATMAAFAVFGLVAAARKRRK